MCIRDRYVKQYGEAHKELNYKQVYLLEQCVVWQRLSVHLGWQCDNVRASYNEIPKATQDEVFSGAKAFVKENKGRYECGGYIYSVSPRIALIPAPRQSRYNRHIHSVLYSL